jgi:dolichyl-phosphate beta-glucosyltransferase
MKIEFSDPAVKLSGEMIKTCRNGAEIPVAPAPADYGVISVVIPAYNEALRLGNTIRKVAGHLSRARAEYEILVVDDGSVDDTAEVARALACSTPGLRVLGYRVNRGKGFAVRTGVLEARGHLILISDADLSTPIEELDSLSRAIRDGAHVAIASRHLPSSHVAVRQPVHRRYLGRIFNGVVTLLGVRGFRDTQCGFKLFRAEQARRIFSRLKTSGFAFDVEALILARHFGCRIDEIPVRWENSCSSRVRPVRDSIRMLGELLRMRGLL